MGKNDNVIINQETSEIVGSYSHVKTYEEVDPEKFVKIFSANISLSFDLSRAGNKALHVLIWLINKTEYKDKDLLQLDSTTLKMFLKSQSQVTLSRSTFSRGINELIDAQIIAPYASRGWFFINPHFIFNGDRIAFTKIIKIKEQERPNEEH